MQCHVPAHAALLRKSAVTHFTYEGLITRMDNLMSLKGEASGETFITVLACDLIIGATSRSTFAGSRFWILAGIFGANSGS